MAKLASKYNKRRIRIIDASIRGKLTTGNIMKLLKRFLKEENILSIFAKCEESLIGHQTSYDNPFNYMHWHATSEGYSFWYTIEVKWIKTLVEYVGNNWDSNNYTLLTKLRYCLIGYEYDLLDDKANSMRSEIRNKLEDVISKVKG